MPPKRRSTSEEYEPSQLVKTQYVDRLPKPRAASTKGKNRDGQLKVYLSGGALNSQTTDTQHFVFLEKEQDTAEGKADESNTYERACENCEGLEEQLTAAETSNRALREEIQDLKEEAKTFRDGYLRISKTMNTYEGECRELRRRVRILEAALAAGGEELPDMPESQIPPWWRSDDEREADATSTPETDGDTGKDVADNAKNQSSSSSLGARSTSLDDDGEGDANAETQMEYPEDNYERRMYETIVAGAPSSVRDAKRKRLE